MHKEFNKTLQNYLLFLKAEKKFKKKNIFKYENTIEKINNWTNSNFQKNYKWYNNVKRNCKAKVKKTT